MMALGTERRGRFWRDLRGASPALNGGLDLVETRLRVGVRLGALGGSWGHSVWGRDQDELATPLSMRLL